MIDRERKPIFLAAIAVALFVAAALGYAPSYAFVVEQAATANEGSDPAEIRIAKGRLSGKFNNRPLFEVLDAIRSQAGFEYQGDKKALSHPVSGEFERLPLIDAVKRILDPFNYIIVFKANGEIERLTIASFRSGGSARSITAGDRVAAQTTSPDAAYANAPPELELMTDEQHELFEMAVDKLAPPPESLDYLDYLEPWQTSAITDMVVEALLPIQDFVSDTGPLDLDMIVQDLPQFEPLVSEDGPFDPGAAVEPLPTFEPLDSDNRPLP